MMTSLFFWKKVPVAAVGCAELVLSLLFGCTTGAGFGIGLTGTGTGLGAGGAGTGGVGTTGTTGFTGGVFGLSGYTFGTPFIVCELSLDSG